MRAPRVAILVPALFAACAAFDAGEQSENPGPASTAEAGVPDSGSASTDSGGVKDAKDEHDHLPDVSDASAFCHDTVFCDDFERPAPQGNWDEYDPHNDNVILPMVGALAPHGAQYLQIVVNPRLTGPDTWAHTRFFRNTPLGPSHLIDMTFRFRAPTLPAGYHANLTVLSIQADPPLYAVVYVDQDAVVVITSSDTQHYTERGRHARRMNLWDTARVVLDVDRSVLSVAIEDASVVEEVPVEHGPSSGPVGLELGPSYSDFTTNYTIDFDGLEVRAP